MPVKVDPTLGLEINAGKDGALFQVQTGNISRAFYDLMKMVASGGYVSLRDRGIEFDR